MDKDTEKRLKALEKGLKAAEDRASAAELLVGQKDRELKEMKARARDRIVELDAQNRQLKSMRDLTGPESPYAQDSREKYDELKAATVKTKDGHRHYYAPTPAYVNGVYYPADSIISLPADQDPSVTWLPVKVGGKNPKNGALVFVPVGVKLASKKADPANEVDEGDETTTNTELNAKQAKGKQRAATRGAGAPAPEPTEPDPGANETEEPSSEEPRPADTEVG